MTPRGGFSFWGGMTDLILTGWRGTDFARIAAHTLPRMEEYARRHGADFNCLNLAHAEIPPSWMKVPNIAAALGDYKRVLWLDADVVIVDPTENIFAALDETAWQAVVEHETECGFVPNCGVWMVTPTMHQILRFIWERMLPGFLNHPWWEQGAVMSVMGYAITLTDGWPHSTLEKPTELHDRTQFLQAKWNDHPADKRRAASPSFVHVTQYHDRLAEVRRLCAEKT